MGIDNLEPFGTGQAHVQIKIRLPPVGGARVIGKLYIKVIFVELTQNCVAILLFHIEVQAFEVFVLESHQITTNGNSGGEKVRRGVFQAGMSVHERSSSWITWDVTPEGRPQIQVRC